MKHLTANGVDFAYLDEGTGPLVVLLHGFPDTAHTWDRTMTELASAGFHAVAPFMRGYAPTALAPDGAYDADTLATDALAIIDALGENKPAILVGHDWGASAAYAAASLGPEKIRMLAVLAIPHPRSLRPSLSLLWKIRHFASLRRKSGGKKLRANDFAYVDELWRRWSPKWRDLPASETAHVKAALAPEGHAEAAAAYYATVGRRLPRGHRAPITVPTVAFAGEQDMIAPRAFERARNWFTSSYEVVQVPGGHFLHREHPDDFTRELTRVVRQHAG